jgi:hypothetical protein
MNLNAEVFACDSRFFLQGRMSSSRFPTDFGARKIVLVRRLAVGRRRAINVRRRRGLVFLLSPYLHPKAIRFRRLARLYVSTA